MSDLLDRTLGERIKVEVDLDPDTWPTYVDPHQLENAILNLAVNARDAMNGEGLLRITSENVHLAANEVGDIQAGDYVDQRHRYRLRHDRGGARARLRALLHHQAGGQGHRPGAQPDLRLRAPVGRRGRNRKPGRPRHLGLDLFAQVAGRGASPPPPAAAPRFDEAAAHVKGARILLVEDDPRVRSATVDALEDLDYEPVACASGAEAIERFAAQPFDLVVSDVIMPEMTGPELIRHLKDHGGRDFAVLFVTGYAGEGEADDLRNHELLRKPFTVGALASAVAAALNRPNEPPRAASGKR